MKFLEFHSKTGETNRHRNNQKTKLLENVSIQLESGFINLKLGYFNRFKRC